MARPLPLLFGRFLVKGGHVLDDHVREAVQFQKDLMPSVGEAAVLLGALDIEQLRDIRTNQRETGQSFDATAEASGHISSEQVDQLRAYLRRQALPIGEALVLLGHLDVEALDGLLDDYRETRRKDVA